MTQDDSKLSSAVILLGGVGSRLRPLSWEKPKPLMPLAGIPALEYLLEGLRGCALDRVLLACGYGSGAFQDWVDQMGSRYPFQLELSVEREPLGTGGAVSWLKSRLSGSVLVVNGDTLVSLDLGNFWSCHRQLGALASLAVTTVSDVSRYGSVVFEQNRLLAFREKSAIHGPGWINAGVYLLRPEAWMSLPERFPLSLENEVFPQWLGSQRGLGAWPSSGYFLDIGTPESYLEAQGQALQGLFSSAGRAISIELNGCSLGKNVTLVPPVTLGAGCRIGNDCQLIGPLVLGRDCLVEDGAHLSDCVLWNQVHVGSNARLERCILGSNYRVERGSRMSQVAAVSSTPLASEAIDQKDTLRLF